MNEIKDGIRIGIIIMIWILLYAILHPIIRSQFWLILILGITTVLYYLFIASKIKILLDKINFEKLSIKLFNEVVGIFTVIGLIWIISFVINRTTYDVRLNAPDSDHIILIVKRNWGLKTDSYSVNFNEYYWKYQDKTSDKPKWLTVPDKKGIYEDY